MKKIKRHMLLGVAVSLAACDRPASTAAPQTSSIPVAATENSPAPSAVVPAQSAGASVAASAASIPPIPADTSGNVVTFNDDAVGAPSPAFDGVVGNWYVSDSAGARGTDSPHGAGKGATPPQIHGEGDFAPASSRHADRSIRRYALASTECCHQHSAKTAESARVARVKFI